MRASAPLAGGGRHQAAARVRLTRPVSTAPGPSSTKRSTPAVRRASSVSRQRTGRSRFSASSRADVDEGRGGAVGVDRDLHRADGRAFERRAQAGGGGLHERRVEGAGDVEAAGPRAGLVAGDLLGGLERVDGPDSTSWPGALSLATTRPRRSASARTSRDSPPSIAIIAAGALLAGVGHGVRALVDELDGVVELERARGDEGRVLAERVAGGGDRLAGVIVGVVALARAPLVPRRDRAQEQRRLLVAGALGEPLERVMAEQVEAALEERVAAVGLVHALGVAALAGEEQCDRGRHQGHCTPSDRAWFPRFDTPMGVCQTGRTGVRAVLDRRSNDRFVGQRLGRRLRRGMICRGADHAEALAAPVRARRLRRRARDLRRSGGHAVGRPRRPPLPRRDALGAARVRRRARRARLRLRRGRSSARAATSSAMPACIRSAGAGPTSRSATRSPARRGGAATAPRRRGRSSSTRSPRSTPRGSSRRSSRTTSPRATCSRSSG